MLYYPLKCTNEPFNFVPLETPPCKVIYDIPSVTSDVGEVDAIYEKRETVEWVPLGIDVGKKSGVLEWGAGSSLL